MDLLEPTQCAERGTFDLGKGQVELGHFIAFDFAFVGDRDIDF
ncbi:hypothetical protein [Granulicella paludicola]|nr:hypothetical protein [Granulicella paludicola]